VAAVITPYKEVRTALVILAAAAIATRAALLLRRPYRRGHTVGPAFFGVWGALLLVIVFADLNATI